MLSLSSKSKFKAQKKEALRKLEYTEANLVRVSDIMREVKRQIGSLQRQAGKARRYQSISSDLKVLELNFVRRQHDQIAGAQSELQEKLGSLECKDNQILIKRIPGAGDHFEETSQSQ